MTLSEYKRFFISSLASNYTESESSFLFSLFIEKILGYNAIEQRRNLETLVPLHEEERLKFLLEELKTGRPYQYILGETEFYGLLFKVNENVLIPRPETEELLELAINNLKSYFEETGSITHDYNALDIGTGSGVIPIVLKKHFPNLKVESWDKSNLALEVARENAKRYNLEIEFSECDYLNTNPSEMFDIIISNPPYIGLEEEIDIEYSVKNFEPTMALFSPTDDALLFYRKIAQDAKNYLKQNGWVFLEINQKLGSETLALFQNSHFSRAELLKDISGNDRFVIARK